MPNAIAQELYQYFTQLDEEGKSSMLQLLKTIPKNRTSSSERISLEKYNCEIDEALDETASGNYVSQEEMEKQASIY